MTEEDHYASKVLLEQCKLFLNHGLSQMFGPSDHTSTVISVVHIQMALELLIKCKLVQDRGLQAICRPEHLAAASDIKASIASGSLRTMSYQKCKKRFVSSGFIEARGVTLMDEFQRMRNALVHFGRPFEISEWRSRSAEVVFHVFRPVLRDMNLNSFRFLLPSEHFQELVRYKPYVAHALSLAEARPGGDRRKRCFDCKHASQIPVDDGTKYCMVCGAVEDEVSVLRIACPECRNSESLVIDPLNLENVNVAACLECGFGTLTTQCSECGELLLPEQAGVQSKGQWLCKRCPAKF